MLVYPSLADPAALAAALQPRRYKPPRWPIVPDLTAMPWFWKRGPTGLKVFHATWEGAGAPRDLAGENHGIIGNQPAWIGSLAGLTLSYDESDDYYFVADSPDLTLPSGNWTLIFYMRVPDNSGSNFQYWYSSGNFAATPSIHLFINEDSATNAGAIKADFRDAAGNTLDPLTNNGVAPFSDYKLVVLRRFASDEARWYIDGVQNHAQYDTAQQSVGEVDLSLGLNIGRRADNNADRFFGGELSWWAKIDRDIGEAAIAELARDPFAPFRPRIEATVPILVPTGAQTVAVGIAAETDTALPVQTKKDVLVGLPVETDTGPATTVLKARIIGPASETDLALPISALKVLSAGVAAETDAALPVTVTKAVEVGLATEIDTALPLAAVPIKVGIATETDSAEPLSAGKTVIIGLPSETGAAPTVTRVKAVVVGLPTEDDLAQAVATLKVQGVGLPAESDAALGMTAVVETAAPAGRTFKVGARSDNKVAARGAFKVGSRGGSVTVGE